MHGHLVTVEVRIKSGTYERVNADRFPFHKHRLKGLYSQTMECGRTVEEHRIFANDLVENIPYFRSLFFNHLPCTLDGIDVSALFELVVDKWLEELQRHLFGQSALVEFQFWSHDDNRTPRIIYSFAEQVLTETPLLTL